MNDRVARIKNTQVVAKWEEWGYRKLGGRSVFIKTGWEDLTIETDDLGRYRVLQKTGRFDDNGRRIPDDAAEKQKIYDGEKTCLFDYYPTWDRSGVPPKRGAIMPRGEPTKLGYRRVSILDGLWPPRPGPRAVARDPVTIMDRTDELQRALAEGHTVQVVPKGKRVYDLVYVSGPAGPDQASVVNTVDGDRGWVVTRAVYHVKGRGFGSENYCIFEKDEEGIWMPKNGGFKRWDHWSDSSRPRELLEEWTLTVGKIKLNDPHFPSNVFDIVLGPDTAVSDLRYKVMYRVGEDKVLGSQLKELADEALAKRAPGPIVSRFWRSRRTIIAGVTAVGLAAASAALLLVLARRRGDVRRFP
jgi:hypothetical protein